MVESMAGSGGEQVGAFVEPRGMVKSIVASTVGRELAGGVGGAAAQHSMESQHSGSSPMRAGQIAYLSLTDGELTLFRAKRGAFRPKQTDEEIATASRASVRGAALERGRLAAVLEVTFEDDSTWSFDVPKVHISGAQALADALA
jgi:hypothetical protein